MKKVLFLLLLALVVGALATGCAKKQVVSEAETETAAEEAKKQAEEEAAMEKEGEPAMMEEEISAEEIAKADTAYKEGELAMMEEASKIKDIFFDYDRYDIKKEFAETLSGLADVLIKNNAGVIIEGHCDERGTNEYNLALGDRRANAAKEFLVASGVSPSKIEIVSYGEEKPQCTQSTENCWAKNRRAHFVIPGSK